MNRLPDRPDLDHLKKQARQLLTGLRRGDAAAVDRIRAAMPAARGLNDAALLARDFRLHDMQSALAREYGFASWSRLADFVAARRALGGDPARRCLQWLALVYPGDVSGSHDGARPDAAARLLDELPDLGTALAADPWTACAIGDEPALSRATASDPGWCHRPGGPLKLPPLVAVTHSALGRLPVWQARLHACARHLLDAGAAPDQSIGNRWPPASLASPDEGSRLSALYGAAGVQRDPAMTALLLGAGADPNDGESLYHALESRECTRLLLDAGARVSGSNAMYRVLDFDDVEVLRLLLDHGGDPGEPGQAGPGGRFTAPLLWAIRRRRSLAHAQALVAAGAAPTVRTADGIDAATLAGRYGLVEVARWLEEVARGSAGRAVTEPAAASATEARLAAPATAQRPLVSPAEQWLAACARGDESVARRLLADHPALLSSLQPPELAMLPELAADGCLEAVRCMVGLGWPVTATGGDWEATALNQAVFRGDAVMTRVLLDHGATWRERHGFGDNVLGSLSWASRNQPAIVDPDGRSGDWVGCARALVAQGLPPAAPDPAGNDWVRIDGRRMCFAEDVVEVLLASP